MDINFKCKNFEKTFRKAIKKPKGKLDDKDIMKIQGIVIGASDNELIEIPWENNSAIFNMITPDLFIPMDIFSDDQWIKDIEYFSHIKCLYILVPTKDITFLRNFKELRELHVEFSMNSDWSFIKNLVSLRHICMVKCNFKDLAPLGALCKLQNHRYKESKLVNFFTGLSQVALVECGIKDITPLSVCTNIYELNLSFNEIEDITPLSKIESLYFLSLRHNKIKDISQIANNKRIYYLNLRHNEISDIRPLSNLKDGNIGRLFIGYNDILDFSYVKDLNLVYLDIK